MLMAPSSVRFPAQIYEVNHMLHQSGMGYAHHPKLLFFGIQQCKDVIEDAILLRDIHATINMSTKPLQDK